MKKGIVFLLVVLCSGTFVAQNKPVLFGFDQLPQGLLLNPGATTNYKYHVGVPLLSGISAQANSSGFSLADLFRANSIDFNTKLNTVVNQLNTNDYMSSTVQVEVVSAGYKMNTTSYLSFGFYTEMDAFSSIPKDALELLRDGNEPHLNRSFLFSSISTKADVLGVFHMGISKKFSDRFTAGLRFKLYSGSLNIMSTNNQGSLTTREGSDNIYLHELNNLNISGYSSGIYNSDGTFDIDAVQVLGNTFFGPNLGVGFDIGFTYKVDQQTEFSASLLDIGFISYSENLRNGTANGSYVFSGIDFQYDGSNPNYWQELNDDFNENILREEHSDSYSVLRPIKFNTAIQHYFGKSRREASCSDISYHNYFDHGVGAQLFSVIRPIGPQFAFTGFYQRKFSPKLSSRITYTIDDFSYSNIGIGISAHIWKLNVFAAIDNVLNLSDIAATQNASFQFGMNVLIK